MKWRIYKEETEEGAFKIGDRVRISDTYKGKPTTGGRFRTDPPSTGMTGTVVDVNRQKYHDFKSGSMGLGMSREKTRMWYIVKIDDSCRKGCFVPGEYGFDEKDLVKIDAVNESDEGVNLKKLLKQNGVTKLPSGTQFKPDRVSWSKDGGYAGQKTLDKICSQLEDAGWKQGEWRTGGIPDGSAVTNSNAYTSPDGQLVMTYSEHFGATAHDNFYGFTFKLVGDSVNESIVSEGDVPYKTMEKYSKQLKYAWDRFEEIINQPHIDDYLIRHKGRMGIAWDSLLPDDPYHRNHELYDAICQYLSDDTVVVRPGSNEWLVSFPDMINESSKFGFTFKLTGNQVNEADEESDDDFARSNRPQIYRYYEDNETPIEEFVKHVHSAEHEIEDIFIQNSDVYENADDPWELFCDDMHGENETLEESLDLDYYMNNAAYEQLPEDIKKYVYRSSGTCDFDAMQWLRGIFERLMPICKDLVKEENSTGHPKFRCGDEVLYFDRSWRYEHCEVVKVHRNGDEFNYELDGIGSSMDFEYAFEDQMLPFPEEKAVEVLEKRIGTDDEADIDKDALQVLKSVLEQREIANRRTYKTGRSDSDSDDVSDKPESIYMRSGKYGSPNWTGD